MGYLPQSRFDEARKAVLTLTKEERDSLTWEQAQQFVLPDTIELARWAGLKKSSLHPFVAICRLRLSSEEAFEMEPGRSEVNRES
jgi:hypothetical protein